MPSKKTGSSFTKSPPQPPRQYKIISRPSSSDTVASRNTTDLSEFEAPQPSPQIHPSAEGTKNMPITTSSESTQGMPATPARPISMHSLPTRQRQSETSIMESKRKGTVAKSKVRNPAASSPRQRKATGTPRSGSHSKPHTPARPNTTPSQAYAGPTFHASPAASSLPIPKIFSKSVPEQKKGSSLKAMMDGEVDEVGPGQSDGSPTLRKTRLDHKQQVREDSPLDILFKAHREEKARERNATTIHVSVDGIDDGTPSPKLDIPSTSSSGEGGRLSRHATNGSFGGLFSMDIEDVVESSQDVSRTDLPPSNTETQAALEQKRRDAQSLALKQLLGTPGTKSPLSSLQKSRATVSDNQVPRTLQSSHLSGPSTPVRRPNSSFVSQGDEPSSGSLLSDKSSGMTSLSNGSPLARPGIPYLRNHSTDPTSLQKVHLPEISIQSSSAHTNRYLNSSNPLSRRITQKNNNVVSYKPNLPSQRSFPGIDSTPIRDSNHLKSMEDYLRSVLKLDTLSSDGANGVAI